MHAQGWLLGGKPYVHKEIFTISFILRRETVSDEFRHSCELSRMYMLNYSSLLKQKQIFCRGYLQPICLISRNFQTSKLNINENFQVFMQFKNAMYIKCIIKVLTL